MDRLGFPLNTLNTGHPSHASPSTICVTFQERTKQFLLSSSLILRGSQDQRASHHPHQRPASWGPFGNGLARLIQPPQGIKNLLGLGSTAEASEGDHQCPAAPASRIRRFSVGPAATFVLETECVHIVWRTQLNLLPLSKARSSELFAK
jgi:hypothetical protein